MQSFAISLGHILVYDHFDYNYKRRKLDFNQLTSKKVSSSTAFTFCILIRYHIEVLDQVLPISIIQALGKSEMVSIQFSHSDMSDSLRPHGLQHARIPCPSATPGAYSNSCPLSWWCHPTISSSLTTNKIFNLFRFLNT